MSIVERYLIRCPLFGVSVKKDSTVVPRRSSTTKHWHRQTHTLFKVGIVVAPPPSIDISTHTHGSRIHGDCGCATLNSSCLFHPSSLFHPGLKVQLRNYLHVLLGESAHVHWWHDDLFQSVLYGKKSKWTSIIEYFSAISTIFYTRPTLWRIQRFLKV